jgi:DNA-directed RNA polymerase specialized sigma subunit
MLNRGAYQEKHHHRKRIVEEGLLRYKDLIRVSDRNKSIVEEYVLGKSYSDLARKYGVSNSRVEQIVHCYIRHCVLNRKKTGLYGRERNLY